MTDVMIRRDIYSIYSMQSLFTKAVSGLVCWCGIFLTAIPKSELKIQSTHDSANDLKSNRNKLTAKWVVEDGKLVCRWIKGE